MEEKKKGKKICLLVILLSLVFQMPGMGQLPVHAENAVQTEEAASTEGDSAGNADEEINTPQETEVSTEPLTQEIESEAKSSEPETESAEPETETGEPEEELIEIEKEKATEPITEEPKEEPLEEPKEEICLSQTAAGYEVLLTADPGVLPEGAVLSVHKIESQAEKDKIEEAIARNLDSGKEQIEEAISFDITLYDTEGNEIQPDSEKGNLTVTFKNVNTNQAENGEQTFFVYHVQDDYSDAEKVDCEVENSVVEFEASHFSTYTLTMLTAGAGSEVIAWYDGNNLYKADANGDMTSEIINYYDEAYKQGITQIKLSSGVTAIGNSAFWGCSSLTSIDLSNITVISPYAFYDCSSLANIDLSKVTAIGNSAFWGCSSLNSIDLSNVTTMDNHSFCRCTSLESVINLTKVRIIDVGVFHGCTKLAKIELSKVTAVGEGAFDHCSSLTSIDLSSVTTMGINSFRECASLKKVTNLTKVTTIEDGVFLGCTKLEEIDLSKVTVIGKTAFSRCSNLISIDLFSATTMGDNSFGECTTLERVTNLTKVATIEDGVFNGCTKLKEIDLSKVTVIGEAAFRNCSSLTSIDLSKVTAVGYCAFLNCRSLTSIDLSKVTSVGEGVFFNCRGLTSIDLSQVTTIGDNAFMLCSALEKITFKDTKLTSVGFSAFYKTKSPLIIQVPVGSESYFKTIFNSLVATEYRIVVEQASSSGKSSHKSSDPAPVTQASKQKAEVSDVLPTEGMPLESNSIPIVPGSVPVSEQKNGTKNTKAEADKESIATMKGRDSKLIEGDIKSIDQTKQEEDNETLQNKKDTTVQNGFDQNSADTIQATENAGSKGSAGWFLGIGAAVILPFGIISYRVRKIHKNLE